MFNLSIFSQLIDVTLIQYIMICLQLIKPLLIVHHTFFQVLAVLLELFLRFFLVYWEANSVHILQWVLLKKVASWHCHPEVLTLFDGVGYYLKFLGHIVQGHLLHGLLLDVFVVDEFGFDVVL
jgi:hypothetical protein